MKKIRENTTVKIVHRSMEKKIETPAVKIVPKSMKKIIENTTPSK